MYLPVSEQIVDIVFVVFSLKNQSIDCNCKERLSSIHINSNNNNNNILNTQFELIDETTDLHVFDFSSSLNQATVAMATTTTKTPAVQNMNRNFCVKEHTILAVLYASYFGYYAFALLVKSQSHRERE